MKILFEELKEEKLILPNSQLAKFRDSPDPSKPNGNNHIDGPHFLDKKKWTGEFNSTYYIKLLDGKYGTFCTYYNYKTLEGFGAVACSKFYVTRSEDVVESVKIVTLLRREGAFSFWHENLIATILNNKNHEQDKDVRKACSYARLMVKELHKANTLDEFYDILRKIRNFTKD